MDDLEPVPGPGAPGRGDGGLLVLLIVAVVMLVAIPGYLT